MRTRLSNSEVGHSWFYNNQKSTQDLGAKNFFYSGMTIYSYGSHYPIAQKINDVVLFTLDGSGITTTSSYGSTTSRHVSITRQAIPSSSTVIYVEDTTPRCKRDHLYNYQYNLKLIKTIVKIISTGRNGSMVQNGRIADVTLLVEQLNIYTKTFKLGKRQLSIDTFLSPKAIEKQKKTELAIARKKAKKEKAYQLALQKESQQKITEWKAGHNTRIPYSIKECYLRIVGDTVETSRGASILLRRAIKLFDYVVAVNNNTIEFKPLDFGSFRLTQVNQEQITIGCHKISIAEMNRIDRLLVTLSTCGK